MQEGLRVASPRLQNLSRTVQPGYQFFGIEASSTGRYFSKQPIHIIFGDKELTNGSFGSSLGCGESMVLSFDRLSSASDA